VQQGGRLIGRKALSAQAYILVSEKWDKNMGILKKGKTQKLFSFLIGLTCIACILPVGNTVAQVYENKSLHTTLVPELDGKNLRNGAKIDFDNDDINDLIVTFADDYYHGPGQGTFINDTPKIYPGSSMASYDTPRFEPMPFSSWGDPIQESTCGIQFADFDNDGDLDFYAPNPDGHQLFKRDGEYFYDVTQEMGLNASTVFGSETTSINGSWGDFDGDGYVDLLVVYYSSDAAEPATTRQTIWRNENGAGFVDAWIATLPNFSSSNSIVSAHWVDFDNDNDVDLVLSQGRYITETSNESTYWENSGVGGSPSYYLVEFESAMADGGLKMNRNCNLSAVADMNNDGYLDLVYENNKRYGILGYGPNSNPPYFWTVDTNYWPQPDFADNIWDVAPFDANLDGINDLVTSKFGSDNHMRSMLYFGQIPGPNGAAAGFSDVAQHFSEHLGCTNSQGICAADFLLDGQTELFITQDICTGEQTYHKPRIFWDIPSATYSNNWVGFTLDAPYMICNRAAIGATVVLDAPEWGDGHTQAKWVDGGSGRASQGDLSLVYGLGSFSGTVDVEAILPNKGLVSGGSNIHLRQVPSGQHWEFDLDSIIPSSVHSTLSQDILTGELSLAVQWYTYEDTEDGNDQVSFYSDQVGCVTHSQVYFGGNPVQFGDENYYLHKMVIDDLPCEVGKKFYFSVQSKSGNRLLGSSIYNSTKVQTCEIIIDDIPHQP